MLAVFFVYVNLLFSYWTTFKMASLFGWSAFWLMIPVLMIINCWIGKVHNREIMERAQEAYNIILSFYLFHSTSILLPCSVYKKLLWWSVYSYPSIMFSLQKKSMMVSLQLSKFCVASLISRMFRCLYLILFQHTGLKYSTPIRS